MIGCWLQCCSWPAVTSDHSPAPAKSNQSQSRRLVARRGQPPARAIRSQLRSHGNSQERGHRGSWHPHLMSWRTVFDHPECIVREREQQMSRSYATNKNKKCWNILMGTITNTLKTTLSVENWTNILTVSLKNLNGILKLECDQSLNWCSNGANVSVTRRHSVWLAGLGWVWTNHIAGARTPSKSSQW